MGEAKRRKQLGLMPTVENREVVLTRDGEFTGDALPPAVQERLSTWAETGTRWDARYRTTFVGSGLPRELLKTDDDLMAIPVPDRMRLKIGLLSGSVQWLAQEQEASPDTFFDDGGVQRQLNVRSTEYNYGGQWGEMPEFDPQGALRYLTQHPAVMAAPQGTEYVLTVWHGGERDGQADVQPEPEAEHRAALISAAQVFLGESDEEWQSDHLGTLSGVPTDLEGESADEANTDEAEPNGAAAAGPLARRMTLLLTPVPLLLSPTVQVLARSGDMDVVYAQRQEAYSDDGETWIDYPVVQDSSERLQSLLASLGLGDLSELGAMIGQEGDADEGDRPGDDGRTIEAEVVGREPAGSGDSADKV